MRSAKRMEGFEVRGRDGRIGRVQDLAFDTLQWTVRYLVVEIGPDRSVLVATSAVAAADWEGRDLLVALTTQQVDASPGFDVTQPVSHEHEGLLTEYYNWPAYWEAAGYPAVKFALPMVPNETVTAGRTGTGRRVSAAPRSTLRGHELRGRPIEATDGAVGEVVDLLVEESTWQIRYLVVDTHPWWPGRNVLVAPSWIREFEAATGRAAVDLPRAVIKAGPAFDPTRELTSAEAERLRDFHHRPPDKA